MAGVETHVCVLLTALDLITAGFGVSLVADAVCSRKDLHHQIGLDQARSPSLCVTFTR